MANWLTRWFSKRSAVNGISIPGAPTPWMVDFWGGRQSHSGVRVNETQAVGWVPLFSGIRFLADTLGALPLDVFRRQEPRGRQALFDHPLSWLYRNGANPELSWDRFVGLLQAHAVLWGNGYAQIVRSNAQEVIELWPLNPDRVQMERNSAMQLQYRVTLPSDDLNIGSMKQIIIPGDDMLHIRGFSLYGLLGERMVSRCREAIGLGLATEEFAARFFGNGANASGFLEHPGELSEEAKKRLASSIQEQIGGMDRAHQIAVLEEGMKWQQITIEPEKAQFLGSRKFQVIEACRLLRLPPHILYDLERATFSNIEQQNIELAVYSLTPWVVRWEKELARQCISDKMRNTIYPKFNMMALLRGDMASRYSSYAIGRNNGWLSANDIRELEEMNPIPGGDIYLQPANMVPLGTKPEPPKPPSGNGQQPPDVPANREDLIRLIREVSHV